MNRRLIISAIGVIVVFVLIVLGVQMLPKPVPPTPTAIPVRVINVMGAGPTFSNAAIQEVLLKDHNIKVNVLTNSNLLGQKPEDVAKAAASFGGSVTYPDDFKAAYPTIKVLGSQPMYESPYGFYTKAIYIDALLKSGLIEKRGKIHFFPAAKIETTFTALADGKFWKKDLGVNVPGQISVGFSKPKVSSGGLTAMTFIATCLADKNSSLKSKSPCTETLTVDDLTPDLLAKLVAINNRNGSKAGDDDSVKVFKAWASSSTPVNILMAAQENIVFSSATELPVELRQEYVDSLVFIYPEVTFVSSQVAVYFNQDGADLVKILATDPKIKEINAKELGNREFGKTLPKLADYISQDVSEVQFIPQPSSNVSLAIRKAMPDDK